MKKLPFINGEPVTFDARAIGFSLVPTDEEYEEMMVARREEFRPRLLPVLFFD